MINRTGKQKAGKSLCLSFLISVQCIAYPLSALAAQVNYTPGGTGTAYGAVVTKIPLDKLGSITLPRGRAYINGNQIEVTIIPEYQFDRRTILSGLTFNTRVVPSEKQNLISGIAYFNDGEWLEYIDDQKAPDLLQTDQGFVSGRITGIDNDHMQIDMHDGTRREIPLASISDIRSPRAFLFTVPLTPSDELAKSIAQGQPFQTESSQISMRPAAKIYRLAALKKDEDLKGDGDTSTAKLVFISSALSLVELGTLAPLLADPLGTQHLGAVAHNDILNAIANPESLGPVFAAP